MKENKITVKGLVKTFGLGCVKGMITTLQTLFILQIIVWFIKANYRLYKFYDNWVNNKIEDF